MEKVIICEFLFLYIMTLVSIACRTSQCTRGCNGGVQWYRRECNSPSPENGRYCVGKHTMYKSCNTQNCPVGITDFREQQCVAMNNRTHRWITAYECVLDEKDQCKLLCTDVHTKTASWLEQKVNY